jgi:hypothetical protein
MEILREHTYIIFMGYISYVENYKHGGDANLFGICNIGNCIQKKKQVNFKFMVTANVTLWAEK